MNEIDMNKKLQKALRNWKIKLQRSKIKILDTNFPIYSIIMLSVSLFQTSFKPCFKLSNTSSKRTKEFKIYWHHKNPASTVRYLRTDWQFTTSLKANFSYHLTLHWNLFILFENFAHPLHTNKYLTETNYFSIITEHTIYTKVISVQYYVIQQIFTEDCKILQGTEPWYSVIQAPRRNLKYNLSQLKTFQYSATDSCKAQPALPKSLLFLSS